jgi:hypothetical protein
LVPLGANRWRLSGCCRGSCFWVFGLLNKNCEDLFSPDEVAVVNVMVYEPSGISPQSHVAKDSLHVFEYRAGRGRRIGTHIHAAKQMAMKAILKPNFLCMKSRMIA